MKLVQTLILVSALFGASIASAGPKNPLKDCETVAGDASALAQADPSAAEAVTKNAVADRPDCACGIVKEVIKGAGVENDSDAVVSIVKGAIEAAGDQVKLIVECSLVVSPDSSASIIAFIDLTYGPGTSASLGLVARPSFGQSATTGAGNNFVIPPAYGGGDAPSDEPEGGPKPPGGGPKPPGGGSKPPGGGPKPPVGTPGDPKP